MNSATLPIDFFRAGGTLQPNAPSYIKRPADDELWRLITTGQFGYVLTSRQMGKSSLMVRTAARLRAAGTAVALIDLSALGTQLSIEQWYLGLLTYIRDDLDLPVDVVAWWQSQQLIGPVQRFTDFLHDVVLTTLPGPIVICIDEIDSTLKLGFTDDFFAAIRVIYNLRAVDPVYERLTFVLLGVAAPTDLIKDRQRTPFNIGTAVDLAEFTAADVAPLLAGLERVVPGQGQQVLNLILDWTGGHPYLTQRLCAAIAEAQAQSWNKAAVDRLVERLFLSEDGRKEGNLQFVRSTIETSPDRRALVRLYGSIYRGDVIQEDKRSLIQNRLKLVGLVRTQDGRLVVRNAIYRRVFDRAWIRGNTSTNWPVWISAGAGVVVAISLLLVFVINQRNIAVKRTTYSEVFRTSSEDLGRTKALVELMKLDQCEQVQVLFAELAPQQQLALLQNQGIRSFGADLTPVLRCLAQAPLGIQSGQQATVTNALCCVLATTDLPAAQQLSAKRGRPCSCRAP